MSHAVDRRIIGDADTSEISAKLGRWYDAHASIRRLWAIEEDLLLTVCVSLTPTSDGADSLPVWLARNHEWRIELQSLCRCEVQLRFVETGVLPRSYLAGQSTIVTELDWRESWLDA